MQPEVQQTPERSGAFGGFIGPRTLASQVESALPWLLAPAFAERFGAASHRGGSLYELAFGPHGWWHVLRSAARLEASPEPTPAQRTDYFALCLAAHFASAASFVPTDVDTKIRRALWREAVGTPELARMRALALGLFEWDVSPVSARQVLVDPVGVVSGHDGERLSVLCGGLVASLHARESEGAAELEAAIERELAREARAFAELERAPGRELDLLRLAAVLTHNAGDLMQGLASAGRGSLLVERFGDLARGGPSRYGGAFTRAASLYRALLASEGHRNYPLRGPRALRRVPELLLPIAPMLDGWGDRVATTRALAVRDRAAVVEALAQGCMKIPGQQGYYRALAGFARAHPRGLEDPDLAGHCAASTRRLLRSSELRQRVAVPRASFESQLAKRARAVLA
ncbi:MAG TPA: hypothetical protein VKH41_06340 [Myxococcota bacterium]|nr:hypothetical protein [Myxococcota bacterium]